MRLFVQEKRGYICGKNSYNAIWLTAGADFFCSRLVAWRSWSISEGRFWFPRVSLCGSYESKYTEITVEGVRCA